MPVYKNKSITKDGRAWQFRTYYTLIDGNKKQFKSIKYKTKEEATLEESKFLLSRDNFKEIRADEMTDEERNDRNDNRTSAILGFIKWYKANVLKSSVLILERNSTIK